MSCEENQLQMSASSSSPSTLSPSSSTTSSSHLTVSSSPLASSHFIGRRDDIIQARRVTKLVNECRDILVIYHKEELHSMDSRCYHAGGPLHHGDIEEFNGQTCIVCPWHKYKITLSEGEALYQAVDDPRAKPLSTRWRSKGVKQRVHKVTEVNGNVYVTLNDSSQVIESDSYQTERYRTTLLKGRIARENIRCDVDENLWPDRQQRVDGQEGEGGGQEREDEDSNQ